MVSVIGYVPQSEYFFLFKELLGKFLVLPPLVFIKESYPEKNKFTFLLQTLHWQLKKLILECFEKEKNTGINF